MSSTVRWMFVAAFDEYPSITPNSVFRTDTVPDCVAVASIRTLVSSVMEVPVMKCTSLRERKAEVEPEDEMIGDVPSSVTLDS